MPRAAAGYDALGTVSDNGSRTIFEALRQSRTFHTLANGPKSGVQLTRARRPFPVSFLRNFARLS